MHAPEVCKASHVHAPATLHPPALFGPSDPPPSTPPESPREPPRCNQTRGLWEILQGREWLELADACPRHVQNLPHPCISHIVLSGSVRTLRSTPIHPPESPSEPLRYAQIRRLWEILQGREWPRQAGVGSVCVCAIPRPHITHLMLSHFAWTLRSTSIHPPESPREPPR
jgi:hypothetical protein